MATTEATNHAILITGASSGIGLETALYLAQQGFQVYATMRDLARSDKLKAEADRRHLPLEVLQLDVTDQSSIQAAVSTILNRSGRIFGLVNNAGIQLRGYFEDLSDAEIRRVFETNLFGAMASTRAVLPHMRVARSGRIVMISSVAGRLGAIALSAYCAAKFALGGFAEALALEVAPLGIQVAVVEPAIVRTEIWGSNRAVAAGAQDLASPYKHWFRQAERLADQMVVTSPTTTTEVARAVHEALTSPKPKLRYVVGRRAGLLLALRRCLPEAWFEQIYRGAFVRRVTGAAPPCDAEI
jgi:NAD(P)-dependent dehydrogenase (short-subunit alcohol dehydrogenase family)